MFVHMANPALYRPFQRLMYYTYLVPALLYQDVKIGRFFLHFLIVLVLCY
jgi:hypothetical protein